MVVKGGATWIITHRVDTWFGRVEIEETVYSGGNREKMRRFFGVEWKLISSYHSGETKVREYKLSKRHFIRRLETENGEVVSDQVDELVKW